MVTPPCAITSSTISSFSAIRAESRGVSCTSSASSSLRLPMLLGKAPLEGGRERGVPGEEEASGVQVAAVHSPEEGTHSLVWCGVV